MNCVGDDWLGDLMWEEKSFVGSWYELLTKANILVMAHHVALRTSFPAR
jgi:hypothetical protein